MIYKPKHFGLQELVTPEIFQSSGERAWELLDPRMLMTSDQLREVFGYTTINDWHEGGQYHESGLRGFYSTTGAKLSQHRFGRANDHKFRLATPQEVYEYVLKHPEKFPFLTTVEDIASTPTWFHGDVRNNSTEGIRIVKP